MYGDVPSVPEGKMIKGVSYEYYNQFFEREDCEKEAKELRKDGHSVRIIKNPTCDNSFLLYIHWSETNPFE